MLQRKLIILLLIFTQILVFGHNMVPHHHHDDLTHSSQHENEHHSSETTPLEFAYSSFLHEGKYITFTYTEEVNISVSKYSPKVLSIFTHHYILGAKYTVVYQKHTFPPDWGDKYQFLEYHSDQLRGPPRFIVV